MKKNFYFIFTFFAFCIFSYNVCADAEKIATCVYNTESVLNDYAPSKIIVNIDSDYNITFDHFSYQKKWNTCDDDKGWTLTKNEQSNSYNCYNVAAPETQIDSYDFVYGDYVKDTNFSCENIPTLYYNNELNIGSVSLKHFINKSDKNYKTKYNLNLNDSSVNIEKPSENDSEQGWLYTCHFNNIVLKFNKTDYEVVGGHKLYNTDLLKEIADNNYSCPVKYCYWDTNVDGIYGQFLDEDKDPHVGTETCFYSAIYTDDKYTCGGISFIMKNFDKSNENYISTGDINYLVSRNKYEDKVKSFCNSVLINSDYNDSNNCVKECLGIEDDILLKIGETKTDLGSCGFSNKLVIWIANIVKWVKYIIPVIVIVLGILDFIKAISSEKDDEMKKAQSGFIKRLIACALIFIIPFIIEFVLNKMGFAANGCGIIDL